MEPINITHEDHPVIFALALSFQGGIKLLKAADSRSVVVTDLDGVKALASLAQIEYDFVHKALWDLIYDTFDLTREGSYSIGVAKDFSHLVINDEPEEEEVQLPDNVVPFSSNSKRG